MNQPIELRSISDLYQYEMNSRHNYFERSKRQKLYLYVVKKSNVECYKNSDSASAPDDRQVGCHVAANTIHIGAPAFYGLEIGNRNTPLSVPLTEETIRSGTRKLDNGDFIKLTYHVVHELKPGATRFENIENSKTTVRGKMVEEVSVFDIGDIGYELRDMTPEQAAEKYFGVSDFRQFFSNYAAASKQMSLTPHERRSFRMAPLALTGMHPVEEVKPPSSFHEYIEAGKQLLSRQPPVGRSSRFLVPASVLASLTSVALTSSGRPLSGLALASVPFLGLMHEQKQLNQLERQRSSNERKKLLLLSDKEREKLLAKGALASELTRRLTTTTTPQPRAVQSSLERFKHIHDTVHQKPTSARIHLSQKRRGGRKIRRTRKK